MQGGSFSDTVEDLELEVRNIFNDVKDFLPEEPATAELAAQLGGLGFPNSGSLRKDVENLVYGGFELNIGALDKLKSMLDPEKIARLFYADGSPKAGALVLGVLLLVLGYLGVNKYKPEYLPGKLRFQSTTKPEGTVRNVVLLKIGEKFDQKRIQEFDKDVSEVEKELRNRGEQRKFNADEHHYTILRNYAIGALVAKYSNTPDPDLSETLLEDNKFQKGLLSESNAGGIHMLISGLSNFTPHPPVNPSPKISRAELGGHWMSDFDLDCCIKYLLIGIVVLLLLMVLLDRDIQEKMTRGFGSAVNSLV